MSMKENPECSSACFDVFNQVPEYDRPWSGRGRCRRCCGRATNGVPDERPDVGHYRSGPRPDEAAEVGRAVRSAAGVVAVFEPSAWSGRLPPVIP